jgi:hypothetical protein
MEGRLNYKETGFDATSATSDTTTAYHNLSRDLSAANRKNFEQTTRKGVPLVYHCKLTVYRDFLTDRVASQLHAIVGTAPKNWVFRNGAVKLHAGREKMFRNAGIKKSDRGRYDKTIRYAWNAHNQTWATPLFLDGASTFTDFGEWDLSKIAIDQDTELVPALFGAVFDESAATTGDNFNMPNAYLNSRRKIDLDDLPAAHGAADHSIIRSMFNVEDSTDDELQVIADDNQDLPPYNQDSHMGSFTSKAVGDIAVTGNYGAPKDTVYFDAPFGLAEIVMLKTADTSASLAADISYHIEVLGISEMQG